jgi:spermidine synthase
MQSRAPLISIGLISASALAYEVLLMRLFSIIQWHHFAYMIISLALLGYGISGTFVSIFQTFLKRHFKTVYPLALLLFALSSAACFLIAQTFPFNPEAIFWDNNQILYLTGIFLLLSIPFLLVASAICLVFIQYPEQIARTYSVDLTAAGAGSLSIILLLYWLFPMSVLLVIIICALLAAIIAVREVHHTRLSQLFTIRHARYLLLINLLAGIAFILLLQPVWQLKLSPYKDLSRTLTIKGTEIVAQYSSPLGLISVIESNEIPLRHVPGLSLNNTQEPPGQLGLFIDGGNLSALTQYPEQQEKLGYLNQLTSALPFSLSDIRQQLIVGAGGGQDILQALVNQVAHIDAVELNPQIIRLMQDDYAAFSGNIYARDNISIYSEDIRGFLNQNSDRYDLIQLSLMDSFNASASGLHALSESYLYTVEAMQTYLKHLNQAGYLSISRWIKTPPRDSIKLFNTAVEALKNSGITRPEAHIIFIRSWQISTLLIKASPVTAFEIKRLKAFCQERSFDMVWYPGIQADEVNRFNRFQRPWLYESIIKLLDSSQRAQFLENYKYNVQPASDDKPFFHHFFKWSAFSELISLKNQGGLVLIEMGYITLLSTLLLAIVSSVILIILPLIPFLFKKNTIAGYLSKIDHVNLFIYYFSIGLAFLMIEIAMMQKFILYLSHPIFAIPVLLTSFLIFAGLGSKATDDWLKRLPGTKLLIIAVSGIILIGTLYGLLISWFFELSVSLPIVAKIILSIVLIAPLAFFMGMPFPIALKSLSVHHQEYIPWAWGINGCASVISAVLTSLLAIHYGFKVVILTGLCLYILCLSIYLLARKTVFKSSWV